MLIRTEAPADILLIDRLLKSVFATEAEADLVMSLRENGHLTLSLVACTDEGEVIGHAMFTPLTIAGEETNWQGIFPVCVSKPYRHQGIGSQLIREGLDSLSDLGYPGCISAGKPEFWTSLGFESNSALTMAGNHCQIFTLWETEEGTPTGLVECSSEFQSYALTV